MSGEFSQVHCSECGAPRTVELALDRTFKLDCDGSGFVSTERHDKQPHYLVLAEE